MPLKDELTLPTVNDAIAVRPLSLPVPPGTTERRNLRTERSKTFAHDEKAPDGKEIRTCKAQIGAVCYRDDTGELRSIDTTIRDLGTHVGIEWAPYKFRLHETGIGFDFESREGGMCTVTLTGIGGEKFEDSIKPEVADNVITYRDVRPGCDIVFKCLNERVKTQRILRDDKAPRTFNWTVASDKPELIDSTLFGTDAAGNQLELVASVDGSTITETWSGKAKVILDPATRIRTLSDDVVYPVEIDPTVNYSIAVGAADGRETAGTSWTSTGAIYFARNLGGSNYHAGFRFTGVAVPASATIDSATLTLNVVTKTGTATGTVTARTDTNPGNFNSTDLPSVVAKTTANTTFSITATGAKVLTVTSIVQERVNAGWSSGDAIAFPVLHTTTNGNYCTFSSYEYDSGNKATLEVTYTVPAGSEPSKQLTIPTSLLCM